MEEQKQLPLFSDEEDITSPLRKIRPMSNVETHLRGELVVIGNANDTKICCDCNQEKNISFFPTSNSDNYGRLYTKKICSVCYGKHQKSIRKFKKTYATTKPDQCMICNKKEKLQLDHCHYTHAFRGWLCINCNIGLGRFDTTELLVRALEYMHKDPIPEPDNLQGELKLK